MLRINDIFLTVQGEGKNAGRAALFIRLPFCNLSCPWCDTQFDTFKEYSDTELRTIANDQITRLAVLTGGEPSMNKASPAIIEILKDAGYEIAMESNGQFKTPAGVDHLTISPKRWSTKTHLPQKRPAFWFNTYNRPSEIKLVVDDLNVFRVAKEIEAAWRAGEFKFKDNKEPLFYVSPEWSQRDVLYARLVEFVTENPFWKINLQTHKFLGVK